MLKINKQTISNLTLNEKKMDKVKGLSLDHYTCIGCTETKSCTLDHLCCTPEERQIAITLICY